MAPTVNPVIVIGADPLYGKLEIKELKNPLDPPEPAPVPDTTLTALSL